jgi:hypothetical protein
MARAEQFQEFKIRILLSIYPSELFVINPLYLFSSLNFDVHELYYISNTSAVHIYMSEYMLMLCFLIF